MLNNKKKIELNEELNLTPYAFYSNKSLGRNYSESISKYRTSFQRDRDRIIHSRAFRLMEYKTQVFVNHVGDYFRTRLTHTLEVAQIAKSIAKTLRLNEDLTEAIALAHDIGHTPFGHAGETMINTLLKDCGGFEHNKQGLKVVEKLEKRSENYDGLNLTYECREGIIKHTTDYDKPGEILEKNFYPNKSAPLEAQIVNLADEIAYNNHDIDDGLKSGLIDFYQLNNIQLWNETIETIKLKNKADKKLLRIYSVRELIGKQINDVINTSYNNLIEYNIKSVADVRNNKILITFSNKMLKKNHQLKDFLYKNLYQHYKVIKMQDKAARFIKRLYECYINEPRQLPPYFQKKIIKEDKRIVIADYIAGMTDRYALDEYSRLFEPYTRL